MCSKLEFNVKTTIWSKYLLLMSHGLPRQVPEVNLLLGQLLRDTGRMRNRHFHRLRIRPDGQAFTANKQRPTLVLSSCGYDY